MVIKPEYQRNKKRKFWSAAMENHPQRQSRSWDVHQLEYLMKSEKFGGHFASITKISELTSNNRPLPETIALMASTKPFATSSNAFAASRIKVTPDNSPSATSARPIMIYTVMVKSDGQLV